MKRITTLLLLFVLMSCNNTTIDIKETFADNRWHREEIKNFEFTIEEDMPEAEIACTCHTFMSLVMIMLHL